MLNSANGSDVFHHLPENGTEFRRLARHFNRTRKQMKNMLLSDSTLHVDLTWINNTDQDPALFYVEPPPPPPPLLSAAGFTAPPMMSPAGVPIDVFKLHSRPSATKVIYLDFDGHNITNTRWNGGGTWIATAYDVDGDPSTFSAEERSNIQWLWAAVAEAYAPFNLDVTTEYVGGNEDFVVRSNSTDTRYGTRILICYGLAQFISGASGMAWASSFDYISAVNTPALIMLETLYGMNNYIKEPCKHEAGHVLGLSHDGSPAGGYYSGHGSGETGWAPIMGYGYYMNLVQWSKGEYANANNKQDDLAIIASYTGYAPDDFPDTIANVTNITNATSFSFSGIVGMTGDRDTFGFWTKPAKLKVEIVLQSGMTCLDSQLEVLDASGKVVYYANRADYLAESLVNVSLYAQGVYYIRVSGTGKDYVNTTGYSNYASLGAYQMNAVLYPGLQVTPSPTTTTTVRPTTTTTTPQPTTTTTTVRPTTTTTTPQPTTTTTTVRPTTTATTPQSETTTPRETTPVTSEAAALPLSTGVIAGIAAGGAVAIGGTVAAYNFGVFTFASQASLPALAQPRRFVIYHRLLLDFDSVV